MKSILLIFALVFINSYSFSQTQKATLKQKWATDQVFKTPESIFFDSLRNIIYVSNINEVNPTKKDKDGFISKLDISGKVVELRWITGLNDPKGMALFGNKLFVADIDEIVEIDIETSRILKRHKVEGAKFLNDVVVAQSGDVYVSDSEANVVFKMTRGAAPLLWLGVETKLDKPNGLYIERERIIVATFGSGKLYIVNPESKETREWISGIEAADGIARAGKTNYLVSNWIGEVWFIDFKGEKSLLLDTKAEKVNAADIEYINSMNILLIPTFFDNRVVAYNLTINEN
ncbi:MAG: gluconolaconase [Bacteroidota bacterium]|nr:gluconolaconase [Bacteroidota bacterium]